MADINRRQFLAAAGASGLFAAFPSIARALAIPASVKTGTINDVEHVVILMQENRSFDHYFGTFCGVRGFSDPYPAPAKTTEKQQNRDVFLQHNTTREGPEWIAPFPLNTRQNFAHMRVDGTPHSWPDAQDAWDHGRMSHWPDAKYLHAMGYYERDDIPFQFALAEAFTLCDAYHCSSQTGTNTNRLFLWSGTNDGNATQGGPAIGNSHDNMPEKGGYPEPYLWTTYVERLQEAGIDWTIYQDMADNFTDNPLVGFKAFQDSFVDTPDSDTELAKRALTTRGLDKLREDARKDSLPQVSYIIATAEGSEHPGPSSPAQGAAYIADVLDALTANPDVWSKTALFIMFDENDGFFDHMPPPAPPSMKADGSFAGTSQVATDGEYHLHFSIADKKLERDDLMGNPYGLGPRVPAYVISPWSRGGYICSDVMDHTSVIRFLEQRFGVAEPNISPWRRAVCGDFMSAFDFSSPNKSVLPAFPNPRIDARLAGALPGRTVPVIPEQTTRPEQEKGLRPQCKNFYQTAVTMAEKKDKLSLALANQNDRTAVFHVYDRLDTQAIPRRYTIAPHSEYADVWQSQDKGYDLQIMAPEGFHRRICIEKSQIETFSKLSLTISSQGCFVTAKESAFAVTMNSGQRLTQALPVGTQVSMPVDANGRYDFFVTLPGEAKGFLEFAGRIPA
ncbi:phosphocholine-specific phospholipase C [Alteromonas sp. C1M14]|uniref:phosphocholine-specific phospholipase C n=1 Tax=Alteromonas sp. C1M14 TaxID=2841567 RepID=UPI001C093DE3|nr:phospholipase C, phosphocholine-specific [Alteromonas sp. C1M14]MBU2978283.1 phospholipase C, phosphocholine-specific [Alteromonas sp. C1M14]